MDILLWLGSQSLADQYQLQSEQMAVALRAGTYSEQPTYQEDPPDPEHCTLLTPNVAAVDIVGSLTNEDSWMNSYFGRTSYNQIRRGLIEATLHPDVKAIVLNIDSGGGTANGVEDVGALIKQISASGKPVYSHSGGQMCSAAYWLGSSAMRCYSGASAEIGSISVLGIHTDVTKALADAGYKKTILRTGPEKALGNPFEKFSDKAKNLELENMQVVHDLFVSTVAENRHSTPEEIQKTVGSGRTFIGQKAMDVGLVDGIMTFDELVNTLQRKIDNSTATGKETPTMAKKALTAAAVDLMLEGVTLEAVADTATETPAEPATPDKTLETSAETKAEAPPATGGSELVTFLQTELSAKTAELAEIKAKLAATEGKLTALEATHSPMKKLVAESLARMQIGLGATPLEGLEDLPAETLLAQHGKTLSNFRKRFPVGGVAAVQVEDKSGSSAEPSPLHKARVAAASI